MANAYRVHAFNTTYTRALYPVVAQMFLWKTMRQMAQYPDVWQHLCASIDALSGGEPIAEATVTLDGDNKFRLHDILALVSKMEFDAGELDNTVYLRFTEAVVKALVVDVSDDELDRGVVALRIYADVAETMTNLIMEYIITAGKSAEDDRTVALLSLLFAETQAQCMHVFAPGLIKEGTTLEALMKLCSDGVLDWLLIHAKPGERLEKRFQGVTVYNGILLRSVFVDMPQAEEYLLLSYHVAGNPEYKNLSQVDRDYIYFHTVVGKING
jgi:hypothetical protein